MNKTVPSPTNWPETSTGKRLKAKRSGLRAIDAGTYADAQGKLLRLARNFGRQDSGKLVAYVGAFMCRKENGEIEVFNEAFGHTDLGTQSLMARKLVRYIEE